jgi:hypothetical protein
MRPFSQVVSRIDGGGTPNKRANAGVAKKGEVAGSSQSRHLMACGPGAAIVLRCSVRTQENHEARIPILSMRRSIGPRTLSRAGTLPGTKIPGQLSGSFEFTDS